jgi:hypothetical protein
VGTEIELATMGETIGLLAWNLLSCALSQSLLLCIELQEVVKGTWSTFPVDHAMTVGAHYTAIVFRDSCIG